MNFPFYIAKRYLISASKNNAINIITRIASVGIVVSAMALFVVLSVFSGLRDFSLSFTNVLHPDLKVMPSNGKTLLLTPQQYLDLKKIKGIKQVSKIVEEKALLFYNQKEVIATLKGVDSNYTQITKIHQKLYMGDWFDSQSPEVVVGYNIAYQLSIGVYDYTNVFQLFVPKPGKGVIANPEQAFNKMNVVPSGIYSINEDLDAEYIFAPLTLVQELLQYQPQQISSLEIKLSPQASESEIRTQIEKILNQKIIIKNKIALNDSLYKMLNTENLAVYLIFTLVIIIALFNLIGSLIMMILEKRQNLKTLHNLGVEIKDLKRIFLFQGSLLSMVSGVIGLVLGIVLVFLQQYYQFIMITPTMAYPVIFNFENVLIVLGTIALLGYLASAIAAGSVNKKLWE